MASYPDHNNVQNVRDFGTVQSNRTQTLAGVSTSLTTINISSQVSSWVGGAAEAFRIRMQRAIQMSAELGDVTSRWSGSSTTYADQLASLAERGAQAQRNVHTGTAQQQFLSSFAPTTLPEGEWTRRWNEAEELVSHGHTVLNHLHYERSGIDGIYIRSLEYASSVALSMQWASLATMYEGVQSTADIRARRQELLEEAQELARTIAGHYGEADAAAALAAALRNMAADPRLASDFWLSQGGDNVLNLLENGLFQIAAPGDQGFATDEARAAAVDFGRSVRESMSSGSRMWTENAAQNFAARMLTGADWPGDSGRKNGGLAGVGFLFDDAANNPMGAKFTVAVADILDTWERGEGVPGEPGGSSRIAAMDGVSLFDSLASADQLARGDSYGSYVGEGRSGVPVRDPFARVLDTLGTYPDAAWDWLSDNSTTLHDGSSALTGDRIDYLSTRDWSFDGWDGFGSLWEGSMHAEGGLASDGYSSSTWETQGDAAARIVAGLDSTGYVTVESLSEAGGANLGDALGRLMVFAEFQGYSDLGQPGTGDPLIVEVANPQGNDPTRAMPYLEQNSFGDLVSAVSATDNGFSSLRLAVTEVQNSLLYAANESGSYEAWDDALGRYAQLEANFQGAVGGADVMEARLADDAIRQRMEVVSVATSFLPGSGLVGGLGAVVDSATGIGAGGLVDVITDGLAQNEAMAQSLLPTFEGAGAAGVDLKISGMENDPALNLSEVEVGEKSRETWLNSFSQRYEDGYYASVWRSTDTH